jgi:hypothetical protein
LPQEWTITYFGYAEIFAPTAVFVWVLRIKTTAQTLVGAISDRQRLRQLLFESIKGRLSRQPFVQFFRYLRSPMGSPFCYENFTPQSRP